MRISTWMAFGLVLVGALGLGVTAWAIQAIGTMMARVVGATILLVALAILGLLARWTWSNVGGTCEARMDPPDRSP